MFFSHSQEDFFKKSLLEPSSFSLPPGRVEEREIPQDIPFPGFWDPFRDFCYCSSVWNFGEKPPVGPCFGDSEIPLLAGLFF